MKVDWTIKPFVRTSKKWISLEGDYNNQEQSVTATQKPKA
jgi:hypothetical protein